MSYNELTVRLSRPADERALAQLVLLDGAPRLAEPVLLAEVERELWAAVSLADGRLVSDPFRPASAARELLLVRARQLARVGAQGQTALVSARRKLRWS